MTQQVLSGVPLSMQQDGWWLDQPPAGAARRDQNRRRRDGVKAGLLVALIAAGDVLVWQAAPTLSLAVFFFLVVLAGLAVAWPRLSPRGRIGIASGGVLCVLPLIETVQPLSILIALGGLAVLCAALAGLRHGDLMRGAGRMFWVAPAQTVGDAARGLGQIGDLKSGTLDTRALFVGWALPLGATLVFVLLLGSANPVLNKALEGLATWQPELPNMWRLWFWCVLALLIWPALVACRMAERLRARPVARQTVRQAGVVNAGSVARSLVLFNALFAVQTVMDILFLYGNAGLPEGISPAAYAHRGAYPLLITALLAGLFAVLARPHLAGRPVMRWLMMIWLAQTLALVVASLWRLEAYVDVYGLTRLRLAAYVWMGLVASGLVIVAWQIWRDRPAAWMMLRCGALGAVTLYVCAFVNFDGIVARHNLTQPVVPHARTICELGEGALPAMHRHLDVTPYIYCGHLFHGAPELFQPADWREWGFRNWRLRRSLAAMTAEVTTP